MNIFTLILILILNFSFVYTSCPSNFFDCGNDRCVGNFWRCDGEDDCGNWADEHDCHDHPMPSIIKDCPLNHTHCNDTQNTCIPNKWICDGMDDCDNGTDEKNCTKALANCFGFLCPNFECIALRWKCDGIPDCTDGSDELNCTKPKNDKECDKEHGLYRCLTGECISHYKVCDNRKDCPQGDDEGTECRPEGCHKMNCAQHCFVAPEGPQCYCKDGFVIHSDNRTCVDKNECNDNKMDGLCSQTCHNIEGSYKCGCLEDYRLVNNSCVVKEGDPLLLFSNSEGIRGLWLQSGRYFPVYHSLEQTVGVDYLGSEQRVFWVDLNKSHSGVYSVGLMGEDFQPIVTNGLKEPEDIAIDWIGRNIYITDSGLKAIVVCTMGGDYCASNLFGKLDQPRAVVVDPSHGVMYWTEWGNNSGVFKSGMNGSAKEKFIKDEIVWPNGLALDSVANRLYWTDARFGKIEFFDFETKHRKTVIEDTIYHPFSIAVFEDQMYWSDWSTFSLDMSHKFTGHNQTTLIRDMNEHIMSVHVFHPLTQKSSYNPCWSHECSHICLLAPHRSYSCVCPEHLILSKDLKTCVPKADNPFLLVGVGHSVQKLYSEAIGNDVMIDVEIPKDLTVGDITYNWNTKTLYIFDSKKMAIGSVGAEDSIHNHWQPLITERLDRVEGLTYDSNTNNLYWIEGKEGIVEVATADGKARALLMQHLDKPIDLALHPEHRRMYVSVMGSKPRIIEADMDGNNPKVLIASKDGFAVALAVDKPHNKLFWADAMNGIIEWIDLFVPKGHTLHKGVVKRNIGHIMSIAVHNRSLFWTDMDSDVLNHQSMGTQSPRHSKITLKNKHKGKGEKKLLMAYPEHTSLGPCSHDNGGCNHICLLGRFGATCKCSFGHILLSDGKTCEVHKEMTDNSILCTDCVTDDYDDPGMGFIQFENTEEDDMKWFLTREDEDKEVDNIFNDFNKKHKIYDINETIEQQIDVTTDRVPEVTTNDMKDIKQRVQIKHKKTNELKVQNNNKVIKNTNKSKNSTKELTIDSFKSDSEVKADAGNGRKDWLTILVAVLVVSAVVLLVIVIIKKDDYSHVRNVVYRRGDQLKGAIIRFQNPLYRTRLRQTDEEEPLHVSEDTKSLNEEKY